MNQLSWMIPLKPCRLSFEGSEGRGGERMSDKGRGRDDGMGMRRSEDGGSDNTGMGAVHMLAAHNDALFVPSKTREPLGS